MKSRTRVLTRAGRMFQSTLVERNRQRCGFASTADVASGDPSPLINSHELGHAMGISKLDINYPYHEQSVTWVRVIRLRCFMLQTFW